MDAALQAELWRSRMCAGELSGHDVCWSELTHVLSPMHVPACDSADANINKKYIQAQLTAAAEGSTVAEECFGSVRTVRLSAF